MSRVPMPTKTTTKTLNIGYNHGRSSSQIAGKLLYILHIEIKLTDFEKGVKYPREGQDVFFHNSDETACQDSLMLPRTSN